MNGVGNYDGRRRRSSEPCALRTSFRTQACLRIVGGFPLANNQPLTSADRFADKLPRVVSPGSGRHAWRFKSPRPASRTSTRHSRRPEVPSRTLWFWKVDRARRSPFVAALVCSLTFEAFWKVGFGVSGGAASGHIWLLNLKQFSNRHARARLRIRLRRDGIRRAVSIPLGTCGEFTLFQQAVLRPPLLTRQSPNPCHAQRAYLPCF